MNQRNIENSVARTSLMILPLLFSYLQEVRLSIAFCLDIQESILNTGMRNSFGIVPLSKIPQKKVEAL